MDYRKFLGKAQSMVLPYCGGGTVDAPSRRLRVTAPVHPGWWRFEVQGRHATAREVAEPEGLDTCPRVRGHLWGTRLVRDGAVAERLELMPEEEPPRLSWVVARRWHDGTLLFESLEFESEAEDVARRALEEGRTLAGAKGVSASLRAAFGYAVVDAAARTQGIHFAPAEVRGKVLAIAEGGRTEAEACLARLLTERALHQRALARREAAREQAARAQPRPAPARPIVRPDGRSSHIEPGAPPSERVERALESAGARLHAQRRLSNGLLEVTFGFMDERFISVVDAQTLQVRDAGVCLAGADERVTLESLPSVIREAIESDVLVITRHA
ncbi:hypothetical protein DRW03_11930 [Corallococcus sp. H22C18031201]|nr:hypothetical protein DRW03_11930 [Corallococcus sp. H22C18031201]